MKKVETFCEILLTKREGNDIIIKLSPRGVAAAGGSAGRSAKRITKKGVDKASEV